MKHLSESISNGNRTKRYGIEFPKFPNKEDLVRFLEENGFSELKTDRNLDPEGCFELARNRNLERWFYVGKFDSNPGTHWIRFGNDNVCFTHRITGSKYKMKPMADMDYSGYIGSKYNMKYPEYCEELEKNLGFE